MKRYLAICAAFAAGCTTCPQADVCDYFCPSKNACARPVVGVAGPAVPVAPGGVAVAPANPAADCAAALGEKQNYRPGLFNRLFRKQQDLNGATATP